MLITNRTFKETISITKFVSNISEIEDLFKNSGNDLNTSVDPFITFLDLLSIKYYQIQVGKLKIKLFFLKTVTNLKLNLYNLKITFKIYLLFFYINNNEHI